jgi:hypothetical protein
MGLVSGSDFTKQYHCPSAHELASYLQAPAVLRKLEIANHLSGCDFCAAELQLLSKSSLADCYSDCPPMPASLRALAEALLATGSAQTIGLRRMFQEN